MKNYIPHLQNAIKAMHDCESRYLETVPVISKWGKQIAWEGDVEIFELINHPSTTKCFAWAYEQNGSIEITAVLSISPINSPESAVAASISATAKRKKLISN